LGILIQIYGLATAVFVGRSLTGRGGQNPIEPAALGKPVLFGPHMDNFRAAARVLLEAGAALQVSDEKELGERLRELLDRPELRRRMGEAGIRAVDSFRGASRRNLAAVKELLEQGGAGRRETVIGKQ
jgi:3-deoxy-D-manno-octulosonic-acid transferase